MFINLHVGERYKRKLLPGDTITNYCYIFPLFSCYKQLQRYNNSKGSKLVKPQNYVVYIIYNHQALSSALASLRCHSPGPSGYKFHRPLDFEVNLYITCQNMSRDMHNNGIIGYKNNPGIIEVKSTIYSIL